MAEEFDLDMPADLMLVKLLIKNKLMTNSQVKRAIAARKPEKTLWQDILDRRFVHPDHMKKVVAAIQKKGYKFYNLVDGES